MKKLYEGKTKDLFVLEEDRYLLAFKDDVTGENGVFDPGANQVGLKMKGAGKANVAMTVFFFNKLKEQGIQTHYLDSDLENATMTVIPAKPFGQGLEVICRYYAVGSFFRRYGAYVKEGEKLDSLVEFTLKDDERNDPPACAETLEVLGILNAAQYREIVSLTKKICSVIAQSLQEIGLELYDIKLEFGQSLKDGSLLLIDEISGGNMRVYQNQQYVPPLELEKIITASFLSK